MSCVTLISPAPSASAASAVSGTIFAWGYNGHGQLGPQAVGGWTPTPVAVPLTGGLSATAVAEGYDTSMTIGSDGNVYAWGDNDFGELGIGSTTSTSEPVEVALPAGLAAVAISSGEDYTSLAVGSDGNVYAWGENSDGQLGVGTTSGGTCNGEPCSTTPLEVSLPGGVAATAVSEGEDSTSLAVGSDGNVYAWGDNSYGQLGIGASSSPDTCPGFTDLQNDPCSTTPLEVSLPGGVKATAVVEGVGTSFAIGSDGDIYAWGSNGGYFGNGTTTDSSVPVEVSLPGGVAAAALADSGAGPVLALGSDGNIYAWGSNAEACVGGYGNVSSVPVEVPLPGGVAATAISEGQESCVAIGSDGNVYAWGDNGYGELGNSTSGYYSGVPIEVPLPGGVRPSVIVDGEYTVLAIAGSTVSGSGFTVADPPLESLSGAPYNALFDASGSPTYGLVGAPSWLSVTATGAVTGTPPVGTTSFSYRVSATNTAGTATAGPFTVTVQSTAPVSGTVTSAVDESAVAGALVQGCLSSGWECQTSTTSSTGSFSLEAATGASIVLSAFAPQGSVLDGAAPELIAVPSDGVQGESLVLSGISSLPTGMLINGQSTPTLHWTEPSTATLTGCPNGIASVSIVGPTYGATANGLYTYNVIPLTETPQGSGTYVGTIPPQRPINGSVDIEDSVSCPPESALVPSSGPAAGGTTVEVTGSGFSGATGVGFGTAPATSFAVDSDNVIDAVAPPGTGTVPVTVFQGTSSQVVDQYTYVAVDSVSPTSGPLGGGTTVDITGTGLASATSVSFGTTGAAFTQVSDDEINALSPPGTGTQDITVTTAVGGTTSITPADEFTYDVGGAIAAVRTAAPRASVASPASAASATTPRAVHPSGIVNTFADSELLGYIYHEGPEWLTAYGLSKDVIDGAVGTLNPTCESGQEILEDELELALGPVVDSAVDAALPGIEEAELEGGLLGGLVGESAAIVVGGITPVALHYVANYLLKTYIKAKVQAAYGQCPGGVEPNTLIDPSGTVLDTNGNPVSGATVTILRSDSATGPYTPVDVTSPGIEPAVNPETTGADGVFHWDVDAGFYEVQAAAPGCTDPNDPTSSTVAIGPYPVPPPQVGLTITLACPDEPPPPVPSVTSLSDGTGPASGGTVITVLGTGFTPSSTVSFGATVASVTYESPEALSVVSPQGAGTVDVVVNTSGGSSATSTADQFFYGSTPTVSGLSVQSGSTAGGTEVIVSGSGFTGATEVAFGGLPGTSLTAVSDTEIEATSPAEPGGMVDVQVVTPAGASAESSADQYSYIAATQTISFTAPPSGSVGDAATLSATGGGSGNPVLFTIDPSTLSGVCNVAGTNGTTLNYTGAGTCVIDANQAGNTTYAAAPQVTGSTPVSLAPNTYTVTFKANGGTGTMAVETDNVPMALTANAFTQTGFTFSGWNTAANGSGTRYADRATYPFTASVTLYAQWRATVGKSTTKTALKLSATKVTYGHEQVEHLSVTVSPQYPGTTATGRATIIESGTTLCAITLSSGKGSCTLSAKRLNADTYQLVANYETSTDFDSSTSAKETLTVVKATTRTALKLSTTEVTYGDEQVDGLSVTVSPQFAGSTPTGTVTIKDSTTTLCVIALKSDKGSCRLSPKKLKSGTYRLVATYRGSANFGGSISAKENLYSDGQTTGSRRNTLL